MFAVFICLIEENEVRTMVNPNSKNDRKLQELMKVMNWMMFVFEMAEDIGHLTVV